MAEAKIDSMEKNLLQKIQDLLEMKPELNDLTFSVGPEKKLVKALKIILKAASPVFAKELEEKWEVSVVKHGKGIPLPEFDSEAFELFVKLTTLDTWSTEAINDLHLSADQLLSLLAISRRFDLKPAIMNLNKIVTTLLQSYSEQKKFEDFWKLSKANLKTVLASNDLRMNELQVYQCTVRWALSKCKEMKLAPTEYNLSRVLGSCLFEIRFPIMSTTDFTEAMELKNLLTPQETLAVYKYIGLKDAQKLNYDDTDLPFKTKKRTLVSDTFDLTKDLNIVNDPPFVCNGGWNYNLFHSNVTIELRGFGFLGPINEDSFFDVTIKLYECSSRKYLPEIKKLIWAEKEKPFQIIFDVPFTIQGGDISKALSCYYLYYSLKGPNTPTIKRTIGADSFFEEGSNRFKLRRHSYQMSEILFKNL